MPPVPRKIWVVTTSWGILGRTRGPVHAGGATDAAATAEANRRYALELLDQAAAYRPDLVCFPETLQIVNVPQAERAGVAEPVPGPLFDALAEGARRIGSYVVTGLYEQRGPVRVNSTVMIDRQGNLVGRYDKLRPTEGELAGGIVPGADVPVFETDFGKVGIQTCFDVGWPPGWDTLGALGAELVVWPSAYDGGFPLQAHAWRNRYYVVSSVWTHFARVLDITGRALASTTRQVRMAACRIDLEKTLFHTDENLARLPAAERCLGRDLEAVQYSEEHYFTLESHDAAWPIARIAQEFGLIPYRDCHRRAEAAQDEARGHRLPIDAPARA